MDSEITPAEARSTGTVEMSSEARARYLPSSVRPGGGYGDESRSNLDAEPEMFSRRPNGSSEENLASLSRREQDRLQQPQTCFASFRGALRALTTNSWFTWFAPLCRPSARCAMHETETALDQVHLPLHRVRHRHDGHQRLLCSNPSTAIYCISALSGPDKDSATSRPNAILRARSAILWAFRTGLSREARCAHLHSPAMPGADIPSGHRVVLAVFTVELLLRLVAQGPGRMPMIGCRLLAPGCAVPGTDAGVRCG
eukprot:453365-Rhodomonas_salina.1